MVVPLAVVLTAVEFMMRRRVLRRNRVCNSSIVLRTERFMLVQSKNIREGYRYFEKVILSCVCTWSNEQ